MLSISNILLHGGILGVLFSACMILLVRHNPRFALNDLPTDVQDKVPPQTKREKIEAGLLGGPVFILYFVAIVFSTLALKRQHSGDISFLLLFIHAYGVLFISTWLELLLADWVVYCTITPKFIIIPGTEAADGYKDYGHQFRAHLRGTVYAVPVALIITAVASFL
jgi:hypothetical protein